jgi:hypothetical protein
MSLSRGAIDRRGGGGAAPDPAEDSERSLGVVSPRAMFDVRNKRRR